MKKRFLKILNTSWLAIVVIFFSTIAVFWRLLFQPGISLYHDSTPYILNLKNYDNLANYLYNEKYLSVTVSPLFVISNLILNKLLYPLRLITSPEIRNHLWIVLPYLFLNIVIWCLARYFLKNKIAALFATLVFIFGIFNFSFIVAGYNVVAWSITGGLLFFLFFAKYLEEQGSLYLVLAASSTLLGCVNVAYFYIFVFLAILYTILFLAFKRENISGLFKKYWRVVYLIPLAVAFNFFWILPYIALNNAKYSYTSTFSSTLDFTAQFSVPLNILQFKSYLPDNYAQLFRFYYSSPYLILWFALMIILFWFIIRGWGKLAKPIKIIFLIYIILSFISLGANFFGWDVVSLIPGWFFLRVPTRFYIIMAIMFSLILGYLFVNNKQKFVSIFLTLYLIFTIFIFLRSDIFVYFPNAVLPKDYSQITDYFEDQTRSNERMLIAPDSPWYNQYKWLKDYDSPVAYDFLSSNPSVVNFLGGNDIPKVVRLAYSGKIEEYPELAADYFGLMGIRYILDQKDLESLRAKEMISSGSDLKDVEKVYSGEYLDLYRVSDQKYLPSFYISKNIVQTDRPVEEIFEVIRDSKNKNFDSIFFNYQNQNKTDPTKYSLPGDTTKPKIEYRRINPSKYILTISGANKPFILIFSETYQEGWKLYGGSGDRIYSNWFRQPAIEESGHLMSNGYANGWVVNPDSLCKENQGCRVNSDGSRELEMTIEFQPQRYLYLGLVVSLLVIFGSFAYLLILGRRRLARSKG